jgi:Na+-transporting methylmalonyl-CoA/oxaloacetate decarboxylase gamma subunit
MRAVQVWLIVLTLLAAVLYLASKSYLAGLFAVLFGLLYCISGVGPLADRWDAKRRRKV